MDPVAVLRLVRSMGGTPAESRTILFTDSRDDAARTAAGVARNHFRDLVRHNADAILIVRLDGTVCFANLAAEALFGRPARQLVGSNFGTPIVPGATAEIDVLRGSNLSTAELRAVNVVWDGAPAHLASLRDMTERKRNPAQVPDKDRRVGTVADDM